MNSRFDKANNIINFWFNGDKDILYKEKWFPSIKKRKLIDNHITLEFSELLQQIENDEFEIKPHSTVPDLTKREINV